MGSRLTVVFSAEMRAPFHKEEESVLDEAAVLHERAAH